MQVYLETNTVYCFSSNCKTHGKSLDVIDFIMYKENLNKHDAILKAKELIGEPIQKTVKAKPKENHSEIISKIFTSFRKGLQSNLAKNPSEYLQQRSLNSELLEVGYNSGQFHHRNRLSEEDFKACINVGLLVPYKGYTPNGNKQVYTAFANNCIIFPLKNKQNKVVSIYGRSLSEKKGEKHYYLKSRSGLYPGYLCPETKPVTRRLLLTEAIIDAATLLQLPKISQEYEILALYGTNGLTEEHKQTIKEAKNLTEIIFFFDGDTAGRTAIEKYSKELKDLLQDITISEVETPGGEDVNSLHQMYACPDNNVGESEEYFLELLQERKNLFLSTEKKKAEISKKQEAIINTTNPLISIV